MRLFIERKEKQFEDGEILENIMDIEGLLLGKKFVKDVRSLKIIEKTTEYTGKALIVHGTGDTVALPPVSEGYLKLFGNREKLVPVDEANHTFQGILWIEQLFDVSLKFIKGRLL